MIFSSQFPPATQLPTRSNLPRAFPYAGTTLLGHFLKDNKVNFFFLLFSSPSSQQRTKPHLITNSVFENSQHLYRLPAGVPQVEAEDTHFSSSDLPTSKEGFVYLAP